MLLSYIKFLTAGGTLILEIEYKKWLHLIFGQIFITYIINQFFIAYYSLFKQLYFEFNLNYHS
jgi:hypothetical protein